MCSSRKKALCARCFRPARGTADRTFAADSVDNYRKGFDLLFAAISQMPAHQRPFTVAIVGMLNQKKLDDFAFLLGRIDHQRTLALAYSAADVFVAPSRAEAFGQVALEAMACGTPVVAFNVGGLPDMVRPGLTGLLAAPEDATALGEAISIILSDRELLNEWLQSLDTLPQQNFRSKSKPIAIRHYTGS